MRLFKNCKSKKMGVLTDKGNFYYVIYGVINTDDDDDISYFKERGYEEMDEDVKKKKGGK